MTDAHCDDNGNSNVWGSSAPVVGKETFYGMDMVAGAAADDAKRCHEQEA
jgi:hypothetical protein